jgi:hypothetical protein
VAAAAAATPAKDSLGTLAAPTPAAASPPAAPTPAQAPATDVPAPARTPAFPRQSAAAVTSSRGGADSPGSMLELLRQKLDAFQVGEAAAAPAHSAPAPIPEPVPTLAAVASATSAAVSARSAGVTADAKESVLTPSLTTTEMMVSAEELKHLHDRVSLPPLYTPYA